MSSPVASRLLAAAIACACLAACSARAEPEPVVWDPCGRGDSFVAAVGRVTRERCHALTGWFGRDDADLAAAPPDLLGDSRSACVSSAPARFHASLASGRGRRFATAVRRLAAPGAELTAEVFWRQGEHLQSLARVALDARWQEVRVELPDGPGTLELVARFAGPGHGGTLEAAVAWASPRVTQAAPRAYPDVILLTVDSLRADAVAEMPQVQAWLQRGAYWPAAVAPSVWTLPSYASLFTAREADQHGAGRGPLPEQATGAGFARDFRGIDPALPTLAEAFRAAGYATCMVHQNPFLEPWSGLDRGFERYMRAADRAPAGLALAAAWWQDERHRPRFLVLHCMAPHLPYTPSGDWPPDPLAARDWRSFLAADHDLEERRRFFDLPEAERAAVRARYRAEVAQLDRQLGPWLAELFGAAPPPLLAFHSDHGEELWDDGGFEHGHSFHDAVARVPLAVVWPGSVAPRVHEELASAVDLGPSLLRLAGVPLPPGWDGDLFQPRREARSVLPLYRAAHGGRRWRSDPPGEEWLPFDPAGSSAQGPAAALDETLRRALAELGYADAPR